MGEITCNQKLESGLLIAPNDDSLGIGYKDPSFKGGVDQYSQDLDAMTWAKLFQTWNNAIAQHENKGQRRAALDIFHGLIKTHWNLIKSNDRNLDFRVKDSLLALMCSAIYPSKSKVVSLTTRNDHFEASNFLSGPI